MLCVLIDSIHSNRKLFKPFYNTYICVYVLPTSSSFLNPDDSRNSSNTFELVSCVHLDSLAVARVLLMSTDRRPIVIIINHRTCIIACQKIHKIHLSKKKKILNIIFFLIYKLNCFVTEDVINIKQLIIFCRGDLDLHGVD